MTMDLQKTLLAVLAALLVGCTGGPREDDILGQVEETLSVNPIGCSVTAEYGGVGEGDSETAYVTVALRRQGTGAATPGRNIELMFSHHGNGRWSMTGESSRELTSAAKDICRGRNTAPGRPDKEGELVRAVIAEDWSRAYAVATSIDERSLNESAIVRAQVAGAILNGGHPEAALRHYRKAYLQTTYTARYDESRGATSSHTSWNMDGLAKLDSLRGMAVANHLLGRHDEACQHLIELSGIVKYDWAAQYWRAQSALEGHPCKQGDSPDDLLEEAGTLLQHPDFGPRLLEFRAGRAGR